MIYTIKINSSCLLAAKVILTYSYIPKINLYEACSDNRSYVKSEFNFAWIVLLFQLFGFCLANINFRVLVLEDIYLIDCCYNLLFSSFLQIALRWKYFSFEYRYRATTKNRSPSLCSNLQKLFNLYSIT